jgi:hypothetical protein
VREYREHLNIGSSWVASEEPAGGGYGAKTLNIPSGDLFHTVGGVPTGFPENVIVDLYFVRSALESIHSPDFRW